MLGDIQREFPDQKLTNEIERRALLQRIIFFLFASGPFPFKKINKQLHNAIHFFIFNWQLDPTYAEIKEMAYLGAVQLLRIKNKQVLLSEKDDLLTKPTGCAFIRMQKFFENDLGLNTTQAYHEALFSIAYVIIRTGSHNAGYSLLKSKEKADQLTNEQLYALEKELAVTDARAEVPVFCEELRRTNVQTLSPFFFLNTYFESSTVAKVKLSYPLIHRLANTFVKLEDKIGVPQLSPNSRLQLYYFYSLLMLNELPTNIFDDQVHVVATFSPGRIYTRFILRELEKLTASNIVIDKSIGKQTDIFVSDKYHTNVNVKQITWNCPPTSQDWQLLKDVIIAIRLHKK